MRASAATRRSCPSADGAVAVDMAVETVDREQTAAPTGRHPLVGAQPGVAARRADALHVRRLRRHPLASRRSSMPSATSGSTAAGCSGRSSASKTSSRAFDDPLVRQSAVTTLKWALTVTTVEILLGLGSGAPAGTRHPRPGHLHLAAHHPDHHAAGRRLDHVVLHVRLHVRYLQLSAQRGWPALGALAFRSRTSLSTR